jgi:hypothetical protein
MAEYKLIILPNAKNRRLWKYFAQRSKDGRTVLADYCKKVYCKIDGCMKPELPYSGNTSNMLNHTVSILESGVTRRYLCI